MISERVSLGLELEFCHLNEIQSHTQLSWVPALHGDIIPGSTVWEGDWYGLSGAP